MDPNRCLAELLAALRAANVVEARDRARQLRAWLARGGFCPEIPPIADLDALQRVLTLATCRFALQQGHTSRSA